ncbi:hypothetical protein CPC08DRAFT_723382 [Agrocybe pediades]|nr:hypothetical protein CPC08DRAFT_723382 [Agrocybe pediades]
MREPANPDAAYFICANYCALAQLKVSIHGPQSYGPRNFSLNDERRCCLGRSQETLRRCYFFSGDGSALVIVMGGPQARFVVDYTKKCYWWMGLAQGSRVRNDRRSADEPKRFRLNSFLQRKPIPAGHCCDGSLVPNFHSGRPQSPTSQFNHGSMVFVAENRF